MINEVKDFSISVPGKWILSGEHAVLRGAEALVFPLRSRHLSLKFQEEPGAELELKLSGEFGPELELLFWGLIEKAFHQVGKNRSSLGGCIHIDSTLPLGGGLGTSASLCVAVTKWFESRGWISEEKLFEFARQLENLFHGESSGVDISVLLRNQPIAFTRKSGPLPLWLEWKPRFFISYSGHRGVTSDCVSRVKAKLAENPIEGKKIDDRMSRISTQMKDLLCESENSESLEMLARLMNEAAFCFEEWGLFEGLPHLKAQGIRDAGALAVKPTGSGGGGYLLSLWGQQPKVEIIEKLQLIPCEI